MLAAAAHMTHMLTARCLCCACLLFALQFVHMMTDDTNTASNTRRYSLDRTSTGPHEQ